MGDYTHNAVLATSAGDEWTSSVEEFRMTLNHPFQRMLSSPIIGLNGFVSYLFGPDGGKDGGLTSTGMKVWRERFLNIVFLHGADYVHVQYGEVTPEIVESKRPLWERSGGFGTRVS